MRERKHESIAGLADIGWIGLVCCDWSHMSGNSIDPVMFMLDCENPNIEKSAQFLIVAVSDSDAREKFEKTFIAQSGMKIVNVMAIGTFYIL